MKNVPAQKVVVSFVAVAALTTHLFLPIVRIDGVSLGLLVLAVLPWLSPLIKSAELPGGFKIEFQDVKQAAEKVTGGDRTLAPATLAPTFLAIAKEDPNLALVGLRIEIERRLRAMAEMLEIESSGPLPRITTDLQEEGALDHEAAAGLIDLITYGNQAAHGVEVARDVALSAVQYGPAVLEFLDRKLRGAEGTSVPRK